MDTIQYEINLMKSLGLWNSYNSNYSGIMDNIRNQYFNTYQNEILYNLFLMNIKLTIYSAIGKETTKLIDSYENTRIY